MIVPHAVRLGGVGGGAVAARAASIRALGGYGYTHEYLVEDPMMTIVRNRWQAHLKNVIVAFATDLPPGHEPRGRGRPRALPARGLQHGQAAGRPGRGRARADPRRDS